MSNDYFRFKRFTVFHDRCSMKVTTDGVLLGAWTGVHNVRLAVDAGTGSGLIALMVAQRSEAIVDAVEADHPACLQAGENAGRSPWKDRIRLHHDSFQHFASTAEQKYDLIVSNPPYFINALKPQEERRSKARHAHSFTREDLLKGTAALIAPQGRLSVILPWSERDDFAETARIYRLYCEKITAVKTGAYSAFTRVLMSFGTSPAMTPEKDELVIRRDNGAYTEEYIYLTRDFYLHFPDA